MQTETLVYETVSHASPQSSLAAPKTARPREKSTEYSAYHPPKHGMLSLLPARLVPFGELMRLHKPAGYFAFYFPHLTGLLFAQAISPSARSLPLLRQLVIHVCLLSGTLFLRGAACTWNDIVDADSDRQVARCQSRPIARYAVTRPAALLFTAVQMIFGIAFGLAPLPRACWASAAMLTATQLVYPTFKRFTNYPQVWLGISFGWGLGVGAGAANLDLVAMLVQVKDAMDLSFAQSAQQHLQERVVSILAGVAPTPNAHDLHVLGGITCLYVAGAINTLIYDTIYGHQDLRDDIKAGVKSVAVVWRDETKRYCALLALLEVALLAATGSIAGLGTTFGVVAVGGTAFVLLTLLYKVRLNEPASCMWCFKWMIWGTGSALSIGLSLSSLRY